MGKAKITSGGTSGLYNIDLVRDLTRITTELAAINSRLLILETAITGGSQAISSAEEGLSAKQTALDEAINRLIAGEITSADVSKVQQEYMAALTACQSKRTNYNLFLLEKESKTKRKTMLEKVSATDSRTGIWCADLTEDLATGEEVGTIEVNGQDSQIIIYPGGDYDNLDESLLQPSLATTPAGIFCNLALMPGWQRWKPTYRIGVITALSGNYCTLSLVEAKSSQQKLNINPATTTLTNVPIEYMDGVNGAVFVVGDRVVIEFTDQDWTQPKVVGFETNPRGLSYVPEAIGKYYIFNLDNTIANCHYNDNGIVILDTKTGTEIGYTNSYSSPITFHCKRFSHNVPTNGETVTRDLYFIATSLYINPAPHTGWTNFAAANPAFALVTNNSNSQITYSSDLMSALTSVNTEVNTGHTYQGDNGSDNWQIMADGAGGDCEDFALTKAKKLLDLGYPASAIHIECGWPEGSVPINGVIHGHAWLVVQTTSGDYALDTSSNYPVRNVSLKSPAGLKYICRRRQIGSNWAFISPFAWCSLANNSSSFVYWYIFDPLLNIFPSIGLMSTVDGNINFSTDNNSVYVKRGYENIIWEYTLEENKLTWQEFSDGLNYGFVNRDGTTIRINGDGEIISDNGFYNRRIGTGAGNTTYTWALMSKEFGNPFYIYRHPDDENQSYWSFPNGEHIRYTITEWSLGQEFIGNYYLPYAWVHIDSDSNMFINGCQLRCIRPDLSTARPDVKRIYKNGTEITDIITAAAGVTIDNILGLAYIPGADRLNV